MGDINQVTVNGVAYGLEDQSARAGVNRLNTSVSALRSAVGSPLKASTKQGMSSHDKIYVYTGDEEGMQNGHWYYYEEGQVNDWVDGGVYNASTLKEYDASFPAQELTERILTYSSPNLMSLDESNNTGVNKRIIRLQKNTILQKPAQSNTNPNGTTYSGFVISNTLRRLTSSATNATTISNLTAEDFIPIDLSASRNLIMHTSMSFRSVNCTTRGTDTRNAYILVATRSTGGNITYTTIGQLDPFSAPNGGARDYYTQLYHFIPQIATNQNIAIVYISRYPNIEQNTTITLEQPIETSYSIAANAYAFTTKAGETYKVGDRIQMNSRLYKVTQNIPANSTIVPGTNVELTNMDTELKNVENRTINDLTKHFLNNINLDLMSLVPGTVSAGNRRNIKLDRNAIFFEPATNASTHSGTTHHTFLISGDNPRFLTTNDITNSSFSSGTFFENRGLTLNDFVPIDQESIQAGTSFDLIATIDIDNEIVENIDRQAKVVRPCGVIFATYDNTVDANSVDNYGDAIAQITYTRTAITRFYTDRLSKKLEYNISQMLPQAITNGNLAVFFYSTHPSLKGHVIIDFDFVTSKSAGNVGSYWEEELQTSIQTINQNIINAGYNSSTVCFITDLHWSLNQKKSPYLVKTVTDNCNIDYFVCGGDLVYRHHEERSTLVDGRTDMGKLAAMKEINDCLSAFRNANIRLPMITLYGNHDRNRDGYRDANNERFTGEAEFLAYLSLEQHLSLTQFKTTDKFYDIHRIDNTADVKAGVLKDEVIYWEDDNYRYAGIYWYGTKDYTILDQTRPVSWLEELFDTDKNVVIFNHGIYFLLYDTIAQDKTQGIWLLNVLEPYKTKIRCIIQGHSHEDALRWPYGQGVVPAIILDCDMFRSRSSVRGTITEQAFSVITINDEEIKVVKVGRGQDFTVTSSTRPFRFHGDRWLENKTFVEST